jgi:hypothetical protein
MMPESTSGVGVNADAVLWGGAFVQVAYDVWLNFYFVTDYQNTSPVNACFVEPFHAGTDFTRFGDFARIGSTRDFSGADCLEDRVNAVALYDKILTYAIPRSRHVAPAELDAAYRVIQQACALALLSSGASQQFSSTRTLVILHS